MAKEISKVAKQTKLVELKHTNTHALLHKTSYHPKHTFCGIIKSQLIRFHQICSNISDFNTATSILFRSLRSRGYSKRFLRTINQKHNLGISHFHSLSPLPRPFLPNLGPWVWAATTSSPQPEPGSVSSPSPYNGQKRLHTGNDYIQEAERLNYLTRNITKNSGNQLFQKQPNWLKT